MNNIETLLTDYKNVTSIEDKLNVFKEWLMTFPSCGDVVNPWNRCTEENKIKAMYFLIMRFSKIKDVDLPINGIVIEVLTNAERGIFLDPDDDRAVISNVPKKMSSGA